MDGVQALIIKDGRHPASSWANAAKFIWEISIFGAKGCQILMLLKCPKIQLPSQTPPRWGSLQRSPQIR